MAAQISQQLGVSPGQALQMIMQSMQAQRQQQSLLDMLGRGGGP
jgi:hypothetical protein